MAILTLLRRICSTDWVVRLEPIAYWVDTSTSSNPQLARTEGAAPSAPCTAPACSVLAQQVIGFKVGAMLWDKSISTDGQTGYDYNSTSTGYNYSFWEIRSIQISWADPGRTTPVTDPTYVYRNGFDNGPYQIESVSVVVNPRNLSFNNQ